MLQREGDDPHREMQIGFAHAAPGVELAIPILDGAAKMEIPPETQPGKIIRLRGKRIKGVHSSFPGGLICRVVVETPVNLPSRQRELLKEFDDINRSGEASLSLRSRSWIDDKMKEFIAGRECRLPIKKPARCAGFLSLRGL